MRLRVCSHTLPPHKLPRLHEACGKPFRTQGTQALWASLQLTELSQPSMSSFEYSIHGSASTKRLLTCSLQLRTRMHVLAHAHTPAGTRMWLRSDLDSTIQNWPFAALLQLQNARRKRDLLRVVYTWPAPDKGQKVRLCNKHHVAVARNCKPASIKQCHTHRH